MERDEASEVIKGHIRDVLKEDYKDLTADELATREREVFRKARNLLTRVELELKELEVKKMEVEQHMRALQAIVAGNSLLGKIEAEGATPKK